MAITLLAGITNLSQIGKSILTATQSKIGDIFIDATHMETIDYSSQITDHPVERAFDVGGGSSISDHIYKSPLMIKITGSITDSPIDVISTAKTIVNLFDGNILNNVVDKYKGKGRNQITAYEVLKDIHSNRLLVDVVNYLDTFSNMAIESLSFPRDNQTGNRLLFQVTLKQVTLAAVKTVVISNNNRNVQDVISNRVKLGTPGTKDPTPTETKGVSAIRGFYNSIRG